MTSMVRKSFITVCAGAAIVTGAAAPASAQNNSQNDGLVNVSTGDVTVLQDVNIGVAAQVVAQVCGLKVGPVAVLARAVDRSGDAETVCTVPDGDVRITQN